MNLVAQTTKYSTYNDISFIHYGAKSTSGQIANAILAEDILVENDNWYSECGYAVAGSKKSFDPNGYIINVKESDDDYGRPCVVRETLTYSSIPNGVYVVEGEGSYSHNDYED